MVMRNRVKAKYCWLQERKRGDAHGSRKNEKWSCGNNGRLLRCGARGLIKMNIMPDATLTKRDQLEREKGNEKGKGEVRKKGTQKRKANTTITMGERTWMLGEVGMS